ncbi:hypothetical protein FKP32DRAFT_1566221 [Trametes sanguinea]|nr:hypothetical protein FKP32DRAFT_1566221 [Trametes sanguinea]
MSETSIQLKTQATFHDGSISLDSTGRPIAYQSSSQAQKSARYKPKFAEFMCGVDEVFRYAVLVTNAVIPKVLWGSDRNFKITMNS